ncbi:hypothetical protein FACS189490_13030 [Clostridia bacterium]|nr:hypothetical protein FACS189490_13030 [Clostridia bacterium]
MGNEQKSRVCGLTGHRNIVKEDVARITAALERVIAELAGQGYNCFLCGGALGFDTLAAQAVLRQREKTPHIKLIIVQPCRDQSAKWRERDILTYNGILEQADEIICLSESYYDGCMQARNRYIIDNSGVCVAYYRHERSGTGYTVRYAKQSGVEVINLA